MSAGTGAASAAPNLQLYVDLENMIVTSDDEAIRARWIFGRQLLDERVGFGLPRGRLDEIAATVGRGRTEIQTRMRFAERFPTEEKLHAAIVQYGSWWKITRQGFTDTAPNPKPKTKPNKRKPSESGQRLRQLHAERRAGRGMTELWYMQKAVAELVGALEAFNLPELDWSEETEELVDEIYADLERGARWTDTALDAVVAHMGELSRQRKLSALHVRMNDPSSTPSERMTAARLTEKLRRKRVLAGATA